MTTLMIKLSAQRRHFTLHRKESKWRIWNNLM